MLDDRIKPLVFLSHAHKDIELVYKLAAKLDKCGVNTFISSRDILPGVDFRERIKQAISNANAVIVLVTKNGAFSNYVQQEIGFAEALGKPIIPLVSPDVDSKQLGMLQGKQYILFNKKKPYEAYKKAVDYVELLRIENSKGHMILWIIITVMAILFSLERE